MNSTSVYPSLPGSASIDSSGRIYVYRFSVRLFLLQVLVCGGIPALLLASGRAEWAGRAFWLLLGVALFKNLVLGRRDEMLALLIALAPFMSLLRSYLFYNVIIIVFVAVLGFYFISAPGVVGTALQRFRLFWPVILWAVVYYSLSFYNTRDYSSNLRLFELMFSIFALLILARSSLLVGTALLGMVVSAWLVGGSMLPHLGTSERLGIIAVEGRLLGNPGQLGMPLALGFLLLLIDNGRWLNLEEKPLLRWLMLLPTAALLALTTSRAAWLVAVSGLMVLLLCGHKQRRTLLIVAVAGIVAIGTLLFTPYRKALEKGWSRTFEEGYSVRKKTSGRSDQWLVSQHLFQRNINSMVHGYGPGRGPQIYALYSPEVPGVKYGVGKKVALHSLFMQMLVETGILGLLALAVWLATVFTRLVLRLGESGLIPLACFAAYVLTVISVSGSDINSGVFLALALLGTASVTRSPRGVSVAVNQNPTVLRAA